MGGVQEPSIEDCSSDEIYLSCGWCEPSCWEPRPECPLGVCTRGCLCRPPLLRHHSGYCVEEKECAPQKCADPNEEFVCRYGCEARCGSSKCSVRPRRCVLGCHCKLGLLRDVTGKCVPVEQCLETPQENITLTTDVTFIPKSKLKPRIKTLFDDDSASFEDSSEIVNITNATLNTSTRNPPLEFHVGVFPPIYEKPYGNGKFFEEVPYAYVKMDLSTKIPAADVDPASIPIQKSIHPDLEHGSLDAASNDSKLKTEEKTVENNSLNRFPAFRASDLEQKVLGINVPLSWPRNNINENESDVLDKTTVKIVRETDQSHFNNTDVVKMAFNTTSAEEANLASSTTVSPALPATLFPYPQQYYNKETHDASSLRVPVNRKSSKPYKDVLSRAVKFYKDFVISTPSSYINAIGAPLSYKMGENTHVLFGNNRKDDNARRGETNPSYSSFYPFSPRTSKDQYTKGSGASYSNLYSVETIPLKSEIRTFKEDTTNNMKESIVSNILNVMREILPPPINFTLFNFEK